MKKYLLFLYLVPSLALSANRGAPYMPELDSRLTAIEAANGTSIAGDVTVSAAGVSTVGAGKITEAMLLAQTSDGLNARRIARATYNCAASGCTVGAHTLGVTIPAKALITRSYIYVDTQLADTGTCTHAISCEDANNIKTATDLTGSAAGAFIEGASTGTAATMVGSIAADCLITFTVADGGACVPATGKGTVFVEYVVSN